jgi:hypothetical protein
MNNNIFNNLNWVEGEYFVNTLIFRWGSDAWGDGTSISVFKNKYIIIPYVKRILFVEDISVLYFPFIHNSADVILYDDDAY